MTDELLLIDLSAIAHQIWHVSGNEPDPSYVSTQIIARVRALASEHPHVAICCDSGRSFRADIDPTYKANRDTENRAPLRHQMDVACETLKRDGFPVWLVQGAEADDIIASAVRQTLAIDGATVLIASADKDLLQLVCDGVVRMKKITDGTIMDAAAVMERFKVTPAQMHDYLCLVGDTSDNIVGAKGIGGVTAAKLLNSHGSIARVYEMMRGGVVAGMTPAIRSSLVEFEARWPTVSALVDLKTDLEIPFSEIASERTAGVMMEEQEIMGADSFGGTDDGSHYMSQTSASKLIAGGSPDPFAEALPSRELTAPESALAAQSALQQAAERVRATAPVPRQPSEAEAASMDAVDEAMAVKSRYAKDLEVARQNQAGAIGALAPYAAPVDFSQQLEPRNMQEAVVLADRMFQSRLFGAYGTPQAVLSVIMRGREFGMPAMASLAGHHIIDGKACQSADTIAGIVLASGKAKYFKPLQRSATAATFKTLRKGDDEDPFELTYTIEEARLSWQKDQKAWDNSRWGKGPADMLVARAKAKLARLIYPDVVGGLYAVEEME